MNKDEIIKYVEDKNRLGEEYFKKFIQTNNDEYMNMSIHEFEEVIKNKEYYPNMSGVYVTYTTLMIQKLASEDVKKIKNKTTKIKDKTILLSKENYERLLNYNTLALKYRSNNKVAPMQRIQLHLLSGNYKKAIEDLKNIDLNSKKLNILFQHPYKNSNELLSIFYTEISEGYYNRERILYLEEVLKYIPYQIDFINVLQAVHILGEEKDFVRALDFYDEYIGKNPELICLCGPTISLLYRNLGEYDKVVENAELALKKIQNTIKYSVSTKSDKRVWDDIIDRLLDEISMGCVGKGDYKKALKVRKKIKNSNNNTCLHNMGLALYHNKKYDEAIKYYKKALYIYEDETTLISLADCYVKKDDFNNALKYYKKALYFLSNEEINFTKKDHDVLVMSSITKEAFKEKLDKAYDGIVHTYINLNNLELAKVYNDLACKANINNTNSRSMKTVIDSLIKQQNIKLNTEKRLAEVEEKLKKEREINKLRTNKVREWATQLFDAQDDVSNINKDWYEFENKIVKVIDIMKNEVPKKYDKQIIENNINSKYYYLNDKSKQFLCTAEYLYNYNKESVIDFAPIAVEYSKVIEEQLNNMNENKKIHNRKKSRRKTLGTILHNIDKINHKEIYLDVKELVEIRNLSAHTGSCNKEDIDVMRGIVYKLIPILNNINKDDKSIIVK